MPNTGTGRTKKASKPWSKKVCAENSGVEVRVFERTKGGVLYVEVRGIDGKADNKVRTSLGTRDRDLAEKTAEAMSAELASARLTGAVTGKLKLGQLFAAYRQHRIPQLTPARRKEAEARMRMFVTAWGSDFEVQDLSQSHVDAYCRKRKSLEIVAAGLTLDENGKARRGYRTPRAIRDGALHGEISWLSTCFNFAHGHKQGGKRLLAENPLHDNISWPKEQNPRRPIASHQRYLDTLAKADLVDASGRLRCILSIARYTGRRESAICGLNASDLLLSEDRIRAALAAASMDEGHAAHMPYGAIRWSAENDKQGLLFISAISPAVREAIDAYLRQNPRLGDVPLFPAPGEPAAKNETSEPAKESAISRDRAAKWLVRAEKLAGLSKLVGGVFHPYRRLWATERKGHSDTDVAAAGGWKDTRALKKSYQQADPASVFNAIMNAG